MACLFLDIVSVCALPYKSVQLNLLIKLNKILVSAFIPIRLFSCILFQL